MKMFIFLLALTFTSCAALKDATQEEKRHHFERPILNVPKSAAFRNALGWVAGNFQSYQQVIQFQDSATGSIIARGILRNLSELSSILHKEELGFTLTLQIKDSVAIFDFHSITGYNRLGEEVIAPDIAGIHIAAQKRFSVISDEISKAVSIQH